MVRPRRRRRVYNQVNFDYFKPRGVPLPELKEVNLNVEELEALRFKDYEEMEQIQAADKMHISQPTFHRMLKKARKKIADALINGKAIKIQGGNYKTMKIGNFQGAKKDTFLSMPYRDGTGPFGQGPGTGRGRGIGRRKGFSRGKRRGFGLRQKPQTNVKPTNIVIKDNMKVIVSATGETVDSDVDPRFGRCPYFLIVKIENRKIKNITAVKNQGSEQQQSAGITAGEQVANLKPDVVVTGSVGPNALGILNQVAVPCYSASGNIKNAINNLLEKKLAEL